MEGKWDGESSISLFQGIQLNVYLIPLLTCKVICHCKLLLIFSQLHNIQQFKKPVYFLE